MGQPSDPDAIADFEVPGTKRSLRTMVNLFRQFFHFGQMRIAGEITYIGPLKLPAINPVSAEAHVTTQITLQLSEGTDNKVILTFIAPSNDPDIVIKKMSEAILRRLNPYVLAAYKQAWCTRPRMTVQEWREISKKVAAKPGLETISALRTRPKRTIPYLLGIFMISALGLCCDLWLRAVRFLNDAGLVQDLSFEDHLLLVYNVV